MCLICTCDMVMMFKITDHEVKSINSKAGHQSLEKRDSMQTTVGSIYKGQCCHVRLLGSVQ